MGNKYVFADPYKCVGCKACMAACLVKHFVPGDIPIARLNVVECEGHTAPVACHHCEDAPCAATCPVGALFHDGDRVGVRMDRCIGCRSCVSACPYGAVNVAPRPDPGRVGSLFVRAAQEAAVIKCDRCFDREAGPACVQACTSLALRLGDDDEAAAIKAANESILAQAASTLDAACVHGIQEEAVRADQRAHTGGEQELICV